MKKPEIGMNLSEYLVGIADGSIAPTGMDGMTYDNYKSAVATLGQEVLRCKDCDPNVCDGALFAGNEGWTSHGTFLNIACPEALVIDDDGSVGVGSSLEMIDLVSLITEEEVR